MKSLLQSVTRFLEEQKVRMQDSKNQEPLTNYFEELFQCFEDLKEKHQDCADFTQICIKVKEVFELPLGLIFDKMFKL